jgi:hypothetical protein
MARHLHISRPEPYCLIRRFSNKERGFALRKRIREHLKGSTDFSVRLKKNNMNIDDLQLIAAPDDKEKFSYKDILKIAGDHNGWIESSGGTLEIGRLSMMEVSGRLCLREFELGFPAI